MLNYEGSNDNDMCKESARTKEIQHPLMDMNTTALDRFRKCGAKKVAEGRKKRNDWLDTTQLFRSRAGLYLGNMQHCISEEGKHETELIFGGLYSRSVASFGRSRLGSSNYLA